MGYTKSYIVSTGGAVSPSYLNEFRDHFYFPEYDDPRDYRYLSRYAPYRQIIDKNDNNKYHETFNDTTIIESDDDQYYVVESRTENRLDMISAENYGYATYWWIIALANGIIDPFDVPRDTVLRIPNLKSIYSSEGVVNSVN